MINNLSIARVHTGCALRQITENVPNPTTTIGRHGSLDYPLRVELVWPSESRGMARPGVIDTSTRSGEITIM
jgi:hypothetical protein